MIKKIGIVDTMFSRIDLANFALEILKGKPYHVERYTVPGIKDIPVACKRLFQEYNCDIILALGMVGEQNIDKQCSHEASLGIQAVQLSTNKHIIEVFVHLDEAKDNSDLLELTKNRVEKHALNALELLKGKDALQENAGKGKRQGREDEGPILK